MTFYNRNIKKVKLYIFLLFDLDTVMRVCWGPLYDVTSCFMFCFVFFSCMFLHHMALICWTLFRERERERDLDIYFLNK